MIKKKSGKTIQIVAAFTFGPWDPSEELRLAARILAKTISRHFAVLVSILKHFSVWFSFRQFFFRPPFFRTFFGVFSFVFWQFKAIVS